MTKINSVSHGKRRHVRTKRRLLRRLRNWDTSKLTCQRPFPLGALMLLVRRLRKDTPDPAGLAFRHGMQYFVNPSSRDSRSRVGVIVVLCSVVTDRLAVLAAVSKWQSNQKVTSYRPVRSSLVSHRARFHASATRQPHCDRAKGRATCRGG